jgi:N-methylhydantoinase A
MSKQGLVISVDIGGTFTDVVVIDGEGKITTAKAPSTPPDFHVGVFDGLKVAAEILGVTFKGLLEKAVVFTYGTTVASNTLVNRSGAKTGLITTKGHEDVIFIMRAMGRVSGLTEDQIRFMARTWKPEPLVPKSLVRGISERVDYKGEVICPLDHEGVRQAVKSLADEGVESIAISYLWSFAQPKHENETKEIVTEMYPQMFVTTSYELIPKIGEYERTISTVLNAYLGPTTIVHINLLDKQLRESGLKCPILIMQCHGGVVYTSEVTALGTVECGPVGGLIGTKFIGDMLGYKNIIATDVGGTTFKIGLLVDGTWSFARESVFERFNIAFPMADVVSIGAGGGTIAWVESATGALKVGPKSAGAVPGPACYNMGGTEPTITDAFVILGYINPDYFLGGRMKLYKDEANKAISKLSSQLNMSVVETAAGIIDIANSQMADLIRTHTIDRGYDPRQFTLLGYGGGGATHAAMYGAILGVSKVVILALSSVYSAFGIAASDIAHTYTMPYFSKVPMDLDTFTRSFQQMRNRATEDLRRDGVKDEDMTLIPSVDMKYGRQVHVVSVAFADKASYTMEDMHAMSDEFERLYERLFGKGSGYRAAGIYTESLMIRAIGKKPWPIVVTKREMTAPDASVALKGKRDAFFRKYNGFVVTNIYEWGKLQPGNIIEGPAIVEATDTTGVIPPGQWGQVDGYLNIVIKTK